MDSRCILKKDKKLKILIDSNSFENLLSKEDTNTKTLLKYAYKTPKDYPFQFIRSPLDTKYEELNDIPEFIKMYDDNGNLFGIKTATSERFFPYQMRAIEEIRKEVFKKATLSNAEKEAIFLVFVQAVLNFFDESSIFITSNKRLLKNRLWFESHYPGKILNIVTVEEAKETMDLFAKYNGKYFISGNYLCNKGGWYWLSFRSKVPNFHVGDSFLDAFSTRFVYLLKTIDEIGFQYYLGVNNDTLEDMQYYFNYFTVLTSGIFDSLALATKDTYKLCFKSDSIPSRISLEPKAGKDFLRVLREENRSLREHINRYVDFINLIYKLRESIVHREIPQGMDFEYREYDEKWKCNFIEISEDIQRQIHQNGDKQQEYDPVSCWGIYNISNEYRLEPFRFVKSATKVLIEFSNEYLRLLGYKDFFEELKGKDDDSSTGFLYSIERFKDGRLGF